MCYDVTSGLKALIKYAKHRHDNPDYILSLEKKLQDWIKQLTAHYHASGFTHPKLLVFTNEQPNEPQAFYWGLIPAWIKDEEAAKKIMNQTLNARSESMFEKPAFRNSAKHKRCLVYVDAFFEHHHQASRTYPFYVYSADDSPLALAGLWEEWLNKTTGELIPTVSIVTCKAKGLMEKIHNNPKLPEARMPVILRKEEQNQWLAPYQSDEDRKTLSALCVPYPDALLSYHTVGALRGKNYTGDQALAIQFAAYPELANSFPNAAFKQGEKPLNH